MKTVQVVENWNVDDFDFLTLFPIEKISNIIGKNPGLKVFKGLEIKKKDLCSYNMGICVRAHNDGMDKELSENMKHINSRDFESIFKISLPQILIEDSLGYKESCVGIHIVKINSREIFINDIVLRKDDCTDSIEDNRIKNGVFEEVINRLRSFAAIEGAKYISGHAVHTWQLNKFKSKGFKEDYRKDMRNDVLWFMAKQTDYQYPIYMEIK